MIDEQIENVIIEMQEKTENNKIKWISVNKLHNWNRIKSRIEKAKDEIEEFYLDKDDYSDEEIYSWLDDFVELINEF